MATRTGVETGVRSSTLELRDHKSQQSNTSLYTAGPWFCSDVNVNVSQFFPLEDKKKKIRSESHTGETFELYRDLGILKEPWLF